MNSKDLTIFYYKAWKEKFNGKPYSPAFGKHGAIFKRLLQAGHEGIFLVRCINHYLAGAGDSFAARTGYAIEHFSTSLPATIAALTAADARKSTSSASNPDFEALEAARRKS